VAKGQERATHTAHPFDLRPEPNRTATTHAERLHLLVISHPCITAINQDFLAQVESATGWQITIVLPERWTTEYGKSLTPTRWPRFRGRLLPLPVGLAGSIPLHFYRVRMGRIFERERPDAIYVHHEPYAAATYQAFRAGGLDGVPIGFYSAQNLLKRYPWPISAWERYVYQHAAFACPVTNAVAAVLEAKGYRGRGEVIALCVDTDVYRPELGEDRGVSERKPMTVGFVGRLAPGKGAETLLEALSLIPSEPIRALIVGDGPGAAALKSRASQLRLENRLTWTGYVAHDNMPRVYRTMDVLAVPSQSLRRWREQFGRVVIEALACGVPVVAADSGELPRLVSATGGGWTFPEGDASALAAILVQLAHRPEMLAGPSQRGRQAVVSQFDVRMAAARFAGVIEAAVWSRTHD
jgi:glycosyltransferase involved in cell wall biosynthesis